MAGHPTRDLQGAWPARPLLGHLAPGRCGRSDRADVLRVREGTALAGAVNMSAYYNENDAFATAWLRELIKARLIADGDVDERSITEVEPSDLRGYTQCHFFAGIGVWSYALRNAGWADDLAVWTGSCPCQGFSTSGKRGGFS